MVHFFEEDRMTERLGRKTVLFLVLVFVASSLLAQNIKNWSAPATWRPTAAGGAHTMSDVTNPLPFIGLDPCRIVDTRGNGAPIQGGIYSASELRDYAVAGICAIPTTARALSLNITVTGPGQTGAGFLLAFPTGGVPPPVSSLNWDHAPATVGNAAVVPTNTSTSFSINVSGPTHVIIDINGYYYDGGLGNLASGEQFIITGSVPSATLLGINHSPTGGLTSGIGGQVDAAGNTGAGVLSFQLSATGVNFGVHGVNVSTTNNAAGVFGEATGTTGRTNGVLGTTSSELAGAAGVLGNDGGGRVANTLAFFGAAGVRGESKNHLGVAGIVDSATGFVGTAGFLYSTAGGSLVAGGYLGSNFGTAADLTAPPWGVFALGNLGASGAKHFVEPHPADPNGVILYSSLEGREVGTYFRGTARTVGGVATIQVPEDFRIVTDDEGLTTQLTPVGSAATMYIVSEDLNAIVVRSSKDVRFHYLIQGVRRAFKDFQPLAKSYEFMPLSADDRMPAYLTEEARRRLITNGTYNPDGTVNMSTAESAGWTKIWADRQAAAEASAKAAAPARAQPGGFSKN
jgi:hypothetical protein